MCVGVCISVISIRGDDCAMDQLGLLADQTAGQVCVVVCGTISFWVFIVDVYFVVVGVG